eukprot:CAMPEP_0198704532 /NCGR_PEP_ID=MMETSP1468-20131203/389945_1 /TAXON_ID=1461545 /ORGANISM="Mantoniella sp, Strain CCMP1436" /LENGTH=110 /DNA_ID=CAMNT_0044463351 /DNA_START=914 /DNA_END=1243 /DNA_ORIENTATION=-
MLVQRFEPLDSADSLFGAPGAHATATAAAAATAVVTSTAAVGGTASAATSVRCTRAGPAASRRRRRLGTFPGVALGQIRAGTDENLRVIVVFTSPSPSASRTALAFTIAW